MMENKPTHDQEIFNQKVHYAIQLIEKRFKYVEVKQFVIDEGASEDDAKLIISEAVRKINSFKKQRGKELMLAGIALIILGVATTTLSYFLTWLNDLHIYHFFYGAIVIGVILFYRGLKDYKLK